MAITTLLPDGPALPTPERAVGVEIRSLLARHSVTQTQLAEHTGLYQVGLSRRLLGQTRWHLVDVLYIERAFDLPSGQLLAAAAHAAAALNTDARLKGLEPPTF
ncbi:MAG: hypothetical protein LBJ62_05725 [Bifidobacteriaceae bacterium]|nr:hypothetical protein [Bifidobacteriaceae bacterium]